MTNKNCWLRCKVPTICARLRSRMRTTAPVTSLPARGAATAGDVPSHQDAVAVQRRPRGAFRDDDFRQGGIVRFKKALALAVDAEDAGDEVRLAGLDVAIALGADDLAVLLQTAKGLLESVSACRGEDPGG